MEQTKRQFSNDFNHYNDHKRQKVQITTDRRDCSPVKLISHFEDLSNELLYEIFDYLDYFHVYQAFFNLNQRFRNILTHSNLPIKIDLSSMSKSAFNRYNQDIIKTVTHRITLIRISEVGMYDHVLTSIDWLLSFNRIETLILDNIEAKYLENLLNQLPRLSSLSSLIISTIDADKYRNITYQQVFRLPALKYCKLSLPGRSDSQILPLSTNEYSTIEHLIIDNDIELNTLDNLLSCVPQLRRLSLRSFTNTWLSRTKQCSFVLNHVTHISFNENSLKFEQFEQIIIDLCPMIQVLHFTFTGYADQTYINAKRWEQLIVFHMANLRVFDIKLDMSIYSNYDHLTIENQIAQFKSPFWIERQWFFTHHLCQTRSGNHLLFYSINQYRRKSYTLYKQEDDNMLLPYNQPDFHLVQSINIENEQGIINCKDYFPNVTTLTFNDGFSMNRSTITNSLNRIAPLEQMKKIVLKCHHFSFMKMIDLLYCTPNLQTLMFESMPLYKDDYKSIEQSQTFQSVSNTNKITNVIFKDRCTLEKVRLLVALCPRMEHLSIATRMTNLSTVTRFLLDKTNPDIRHLYSICFSRAYNDKWFQNLDTLLESEALLNSYTLKSVNSKLYLWW